MKNFLFLFLLLSCAPSSGIDLQSLPIKNTIYLSDVHITGELSQKNVSREELLKPLLSTLDLFCEEKNFFDEPKNEPEEIQQDGELRPKWLKAYLSGRRSYYFNQPTGYIGKYYVYGKNDVPLPPQVCPDFIVDTLERASGTWYNASSKDPKRNFGTVEIRDTASVQGYDVRRIFELIDFFKTQPENYQFIFDGTGPKVGNVKNLKRWLKEKDVQVGDIIIVSGKAPWDFETHWHQHSMFVRNLDKEGFVEYIVGNSNWAQKRYLSLEVARAPKRRVIYIIRLTDKFLKQYLTKGE